MVETTKPTSAQSSSTGGASGAGLPSPSKGARRPRLVALIEGNRVLVGSTVAFVLFLAIEGFLLGEVRYPAPLGVIVNGMIIGGLTALIAFGIALVYRANRIINFAQGDLGAIPAVLAVLLIVGPQVPFFVAMATGVVAAIVLGIAVETLIVRRFFKAPRLILTVATIGLAQILAFGEMLLPQAFDLTVPPQSFPSPFDFSFEISPIVFGGNDVVAMLAVPTTIAALVVFFRYTNIGLAVRASAESADRAFLLGIPVKRIHTAVWVIATVLATVAMLLRAGIVGLPIGSVLGPGILLRALAAAVIGRMEHLHHIFAGAILLGIVEQAVVWHTARGLLADPILFGVVLVGLLLQRRGEASRVRDADTSSWQAAKEVRPIPRELAKVPEVRMGVPALLGTLLLIAALLPVFLPASRLNLIGAVFIFAIIGLSLVVLTGWGGQISLGQMAFVGIGAAVAGAITKTLSWDFLLAILLAGVVGALVATIIGIPALRIRGMFLAVATLAFALATSSYFLNFEFFGWWLPAGRIPRDPLFGRIPIDSETLYYYVALAGLLFALFAVQGIRRARTGRVLIGIRENERAAQGFGLNVTKARLQAFAISGFLAAYAGGIFIHHQQSLEVQSFAPAESLKAFTMVVIGGLGSVPGALFGAIYLRGIDWLLPSSFGFLASGAGLVLVLMLVPGGLGPAVHGIRNWVLRRVADRHGILVPSLVADARNQEVVAERSASTQLLASEHPDSGSSDGSPRRRPAGGERDARQRRGEERKAVRSRGEMRTGHDDRGKGRERSRMAQTKRQSASKDEAPRKRTMRKGGTGSSRSGSDRSKGVQEERHSAASREQREERRRS